MQVLLAQAMWSSISQLCKTGRSLVGNYGEKTTKKPEILQMVRKKVPKGEKERKSKTAWKLTEAHLTEVEYLD